MVSTDLQTHMVSLSEIVPYAGNAKEHPEWQVDQLVSSIEKFGNCDPIAVWHNQRGQPEIVEGHGRLMALEKLGYEEAPVIFLDHLTDEQRRAYALVHNQLTMNTGFDMETLEVELGNIIDIDMSQFDFDVPSPSVGEPTEIVEDEVPEDAPSIVQKGDLWQLGRHRLMCGDSTDADNVARLMDGTKADMVLTDPPYGMHLDTDFSSIHGSLRNGTRGNKYKRVIGDNDDFTPDLISTVFDNLTANEVFLFGADYYAEHIPNRLDGSWLVWDKRKESQADAIGSEFELIWSKCRHKRRVLRHDWFGFLSSENSKDARNRVHPTQKPVTLLTDIIEQWGADAKTIVDLYGGSGSTLIAAEQLDRTCYMMELDPHYCDIIIERWQNLTGETARKVEQNGQAD